MLYWNLKINSQVCDGAEFRGVHCNSIIMLFTQHKFTLASDFFFNLSENKATSLRFPQMEREDHFILRNKVSGFLPCCRVQTQAHLPKQLSPLSRPLPCQGQRRREDQ